MGRKVHGLDKEVAGAHGRVEDLDVEESPYDFLPSDAVALGVGAAEFPHLLVLGLEPAAALFLGLPEERPRDLELLFQHSGELTIWTPTPIDEETLGLESETIEEDVLQLNRHAGEGDAETDELLDELRRKALEDESADGQEDETGMDGDAEPPGEGG